VLSFRHQFQNDYVDTFKMKDNPSTSPDKGAHYGYKSKKSPSLVTKLS
jgi:hypothetical protein